MVGVLEKAALTLELITTDHVKKELEEISKYGDDVAEASERVLYLISEEMIIVKDISENSIEDFIGVKVDRGEASCFLCAKKHGVRNLIMKDVEAASQLEGKAIKEGIKQKISVAVIVELENRGLVSKDEAKEVVEQLIEIKDWRGSVLEVLAKKYLY